jgi:hypothetical protein
MQQVRDEGGEDRGAAAGLAHELASKENTQRLAL